MIRGSDWPTIIIRGAFIVVLAVAAIYLYQRYEVVHLGKTDDSMEVIVPQKDARELVAGFPRDGLLLLDHAELSNERNQVVAYVLAGDAKTSEEVRVGRLCGFPGDRLTANKDGVLINGILARVGKNPIHQLPVSLSGQSLLLEDQYLVFNDNPHSMLPDSRNFGVLRRDQIRAVVVRNWPW